MRWSYLYPQREFPYERLVAENRRRGRHDPEFELLDTGVFDDDRYWDITVDYAKAGTRRHLRPGADPQRRARRGDAARAADDVVPQHVVVGPRRSQAGRSSTRTAPWSPSTTISAAWCSSATAPDERLFCDNESNAGRLWGVDGPAYPKDGIGDHVVHGAATVNPERVGTKAALWYRLTVAAGESSRAAPAPVARRAAA